MGLQEHNKRPITLKKVHKEGRIKFPKPYQNLLIIHITIIATKASQNYSKT